MREAIVTDGLWRKSLSAVRSLGKAHYDVCVFGDSFFTTAFWSRFTYKRVICKSAKDDSEAFGESLLAYLRSRERNDKPILLPMEDATLEWVSLHREQLSAYADFLLPPKESLDIAQSKFATISLGARLGLPVPETMIVSCLQDLILKIKSLTESDQLSHYLVKPVSGSGSAGIIYLDEKEHPDWNKHWALYGPLIIQKRIATTGQGLGVSVLFDRQGECVASFVHARCQEYPNSGGPSTSRISIENADLVEKSIRLLKELSWRGVAMVEWKQDPDDNIPKLLEINPRFWGSLELAVRSGVNFPLVYAQVVAGETLEPYKPYRNGVVCRWMLPGEILRYITQDKIKREGLTSFMRGLPETAEEWDRADLRGFISSILCPAIAVLNPKYWKYLRR